MKTVRILSGISLLLVGILNSSAWAAETISTSCNMVTTSIMPSGSRTDAENATFSSVIGFDYDTRGYEPPVIPVPTQLASAPEVGTVWGKAYNPNTQKLYVAAFLRRHAPISPDGLGAIYEIDVSDTTSDATIGTPTLWMDLNSTTHLGATATLFPSETDANRGLNAPFAPSYDVWSFDKVGKQGIGGLELSDDFSMVYAMDLTNRQLLVIDTATKTVTARHAITDPGCNNSADVRPFGVDYLNGDVYVGVTCSMETAASGRPDTHIMRLSGGSFSSVVIGSTRGYRWSNFWQNDPAVGGCTASNRGDYVPVVTNMELDESGNMIIGVTTVNGWRYANRNYAPIQGCTELIAVDTSEHSTRGYVLHATPSGGDWVIASSEEEDTSGFTHRYREGQYAHWGAGASHTYQSGMSVTDCSGQETVIVNLMDPLNHESGGTRWMRTADAQNEAATNIGDVDIATSENSTFELYRTDLSDPADAPTWEKSAGLGDIEYLRSAACSLNMPTVTTQCNNAGTASDPSDDTFTYTINTTGTGIGASYSISSGDTQSGITYGSDYTSTTTFPISGGNISLTLTDVDTASCTLTPVTVTAPATCSSGTPQVDIALSKTVNPISATSGDTVTYTLVATNNGSDDATGVVVSDPLPVGVTYDSDDGGANTSESGGTVTWNLGNLAVSASVTLNITVTVD